VQRRYSNRERADMPWRDYDMDEGEEQCYDSNRERADMPWRGGIRMG